MILTCPACTMRYLVSEGSIGPNGRRVRCANCGHQWTQEPEEGLDEALFGEAPAFLETPPPDSFDETPAQADEAEDFQSILRKEIEASPIPEGVHPDLDDPVLNQLMKDKAERQKKKVPKDRMAGFATAVCFWLLILGAFLFFQPQISRAWPPSNLLYDLVGLAPVPPGEGLSLDNLEAEIGEGKIIMKGTISNLKSSDVKVPAVVASIIDDNEKVIDQMLIAPPIARIKPEGQVPFDVVYPKIPDGATNVTFAFSYIDVPASEGKEETSEPAREGESVPPPHEEHPAAAPEHDAPDVQPEHEPEHSEPALH